MRSLWLILLFLFFTALPGAASAQTRSDQFIDVPVCSELTNKSGFAIYGSVETDKVKMPDGDTAYYKSNIRLQANETTQICSNGPFFEGQKLILTLRSLFPLFECKTKLGQPIAINATPKKDGNGYDWSATCY